MSSVSRPRRIINSAVVSAIGAALGVSLWLGAPSWNRHVFGRYSVKRFAAAVAVSAVAAFATSTYLRRLWSNRRPVTPRAQRLSIGRKCLFSAAILIPVFIAVEACLRWYYFPASPRLFHPEAGSAMGFHALLQHADRTVHDGQFVRAYRGQMYDRHKTARFRIACLGGSTTWGHHLERPATWPAMLEAGLRDLGYDVEVINAGRAWYTSAHSLVDYAVQVRYYEPDIVIVMHGVNDLARSFPAPGEPPPEWDYGSYQGPMRNVLAGYRAHNRDREWAAWNPLRMARSLAVHRLLFDRPLSGAHVPDAEVGLEAFPTLRSFGAHLEYLARLCAYDNRKVVFATQAHIYDCADATALTDINPAMRTVYLKTAEGVPISAGSLRLAMRAVRETTLEVAQTRDIPVADVERAMQCQKRCFMDDFHLTAEGNARAAQAILDVVRPMLDGSTGPKY